MRNKCLLGLGLVFVISLTSMVAFAFSFTGTPADEVDETEMIVRAVVSEEADAMPTTEPITTILVFTTTIFCLLSTFIFTFVYSSLVGIRSLSFVAAHLIST